MHFQPPNRWLVWPLPRLRPRLRLFCFPFAGGAASVFRSWPEGLPDDVEVCAIQLPGRENRVREENYTDFTDLVDQLTQILIPHLRHPFAFYGHSMGTLAAFEVARQLRRDVGVLPLHLFVGAGRAPSLPSRQPMLHNAPDSEFLDVIRRLGGLPTEIVHNATTMRFFLPLWRGDFSLAASHVYVAEQPLACSISAFGGEQDEIVPPEDLQAWKEETSGSFSVRMFPDGHFFLRKYAPQLLQAISGDLATYSHNHFE